GGAFHVIGEFQSVPRGGGRVERDREETGGFGDEGLAAVPVEGQQGSRRAFREGKQAFGHGGHVPGGGAIGRGGAQGGRGHGEERELGAARDDGGEEGAAILAGDQEIGVRRGLFQGLEQGVGHRGVHAFGPDHD